MSQLKWRQLPFVNKPNRIRQGKYISYVNEQLQIVKDLDQLTIPFDINSQPGMFTSKYNEISNYDNIFFNSTGNQIALGYIDQLLFYVTDYVTLENSSVVFYGYFEPNNIFWYLKADVSNQIHIYYFDANIKRFVHLADSTINNNNKDDQYIVRLQILPDKKILRIFNYDESTTYFETIELDQQYHILSRQMIVDELPYLDQLNQHTTTHLYYLFSYEHHLNYDGSRLLINAFSMQEEEVITDTQISVLDLNTTPFSTIMFLSWNQYYFFSNCWTKDNKVKFVQTTSTVVGESRVVLNLSYYDCNSLTFYSNPYKPATILLLSELVEINDHLTNPHTYQDDNLYFVDYKQQLIYINFMKNIRHVVNLDILPDILTHSYNIKLCSAKNIIIFIGNHKNPNYCYIFDKLDYKLLPYYIDVDSRQMYHNTQIMLLARQSGTSTNLTMLPEEMVSTILSKLN